MEAVHSRAFRGIQQSSLLPLIAPVLAAAAGYMYVQTTLENVEIVLAGLATLSVVPALIAPSSTAAVLLPLIDSANHLPKAKPLRASRSDVADL